MKTKFNFMVIALCIFLKVNANNDKYRLILVSDPSSTITVAWNQISGANPIVYYDTVDHGTDYTQYSFSKTVDRSVSARGMSNQFARLTGLTPNTNYYFVINDSEGTSQRFWFRTAPDDNSRLSFIAGGDSRNNRVPRQNANKLVSKLKPHAVLFGGDMTDDDTNAEWQDWFDDWQLTTASDGRMFPIVPSRGNHESTTIVYNLFDTPNSNSYYAMTWGNNLIRTYTLNSEISVLGNQLTWLQNDLAAASGLTWKMAQYHKPMRPHTAAKSEGNSEYNAWAQLFYDEKVRLVVDCDSHMAKTTWPVKPSSDVGNDEGFVIDQLNGTVYTGEGCWGAPLRPNNDDKSWTRNSGTFNQFKLIFVEESKIELRTVDVNNADSVAEVSNTDPFTLPANINIFSPPTGAVVTISNSIDNGCPIVGTACDDNDANTLNDEEDGFCNCEGLPSNELVDTTVSVSSSSDDAEEEVATGTMNLTSNDLELIYDGGAQLVGIRFDNVQIPDGATLYRAYLQFQTDETDSEEDPTNLIIHGELSPTSMTFTSDVNNISSRSLTTNSVNWSEIPLWDTVDEAGINQRTPYVTSVVQEIIDQPGWQTGNAVTFIISGQGKRVAEAFDGSAPPVLKLFYQSPCNPAGTACDDGDANTILDIEDGNCNCVGIEASGTFNYQVNNGDDDAEQAESGGAMYTDSSDLELVFDSFAGQNNQTVGIRFNDISLPQGVTILNAYIQFTTDELGSEATNLAIRGEKNDNSAIFTIDNFNISSRAVTTSMVHWNNVPEWNSVGASGVDQQTPNLREIVQEIIDVPNWQPFNSMSFFITGSGKRTAESFNGSQSDAPRLVINYTFDNTCPIVGTPCDDSDANTINDEEDGFCNCVGIPNDVVEDTDSVLTSSDDAEEELFDAGDMDITSGDLELIYDGGEQLVGVRFDNVQIPDGATLYRAYLQFQTDETDSEEDPTNLTIHGELSTASQTFQDVAGNISSRALTSQAVNWNEIPLWDAVGEAGLHQRSPYVTNIVKEIIDQAGWQQGNAVTFIISGQGKRVAESIDGSAAPILKLFYQTPCSPAGTTCDDGDPDTILDIEDGNCNCAGIPENGTLTYAVNRSNNDAEEEVATGDMDITSTDLELIAESGSSDQYVGVRFTDIHLPANATITNAYIQFTADDDNTGQTDLQIKAEANANSLEFSSADHDISSRTTGVNMVAWNNIPAWNTGDIGSAGLNQRTPDISSLVGEILSQPNWQLLNSMTFIITGAGEREAESFDGSAAPQLIIEYSLQTLSREKESVNVIKFYPNPANNWLYVDTGNSNSEQFTIYDISGKIIKTIESDSQNNRINISNLSKGVYFVEVKLTNGSKNIKKIIKK